MADEEFRAAQLWHAVLLNSATAEMVEKYGALMKRRPVEIRLIGLAASSPDWLLRDYGAALHLPKSTLTSLIDRLEKEALVKRVLSPRDRRSYSLALGARGPEFLRLYTAYQEEIGGRILAALDAAERRQLLALLEKVAAAMEGA